jgi:hypothetical protein
MDRSKKGARSCRVRSEGGQNCVISDPSHAVLPSGKRSSQLRTFQADCGPSYSDKVGHDPANARKRIQAMYIGGGLLGLVVLIVIVVLVMRVI